MSWSTWIDTEIKLLPLVQPDLGQPGVVVVDDGGCAAGEGIGRGLPEHMTDVRARGYQHLAAAHPDLEGAKNKRGDDRLEGNQLEGHQNMVQIVLKFSDC